MLIIFSLKNSDGQPLKKKIKKNDNSMIVTNRQKSWNLISIWSRCKCLVLRNSEQLAAAKVEWPEWVKVFWLIMIMNSDCTNWL